MIDDTTELSKSIGLRSIQSTKDAYVVITGRRQKEKEFVKIKSDFIDAMA
jgi:hypothetical protein